MQFTVTEDIGTDPPSILMHFMINKVSILTGNMPEVEKTCNQQSVYTVILALESVIITFDRRIR